MSINQSTGFTLLARKSLSNAQVIAQNEGTRLRVAHLLIGLAQLPIDQSGAAHVLNGLEITAEKLQVLSSQDTDQSLQPGLKDDLQKTMEGAAAIAQKRGDPSISSSHLLASLLEDEAIPHLLAQLGITKDRIRTALYSLQIWTNEP